MADEESGNAANRKAAATAFLSFAESAVALQKEMLQTYERLSRAWLDRIQAEVELWGDLAKTLASSKSATEALKAYGDCVARQIQMSAEDGRHLFSDYREITQKIAKVVTEDARIAGEAASAMADEATETRVTH
jgi:hypothetical protein